MLDNHTLKDIYHLLKFEKKVSNQAEFGSKLGYTRSHFSQIMNGAQPVTEKLERQIEQVFGKKYLKGAPEPPATTEQWSPSTMYVEDFTGGENAKNTESEFDTIVNRHYARFDALERTLSKDQKFAYRHLYNNVAPEKMWMYVLANLDK